MTKKLIGKVALVTGGSRGIGAAIVKRLAEEGAQVAFTYSSSKEAADKLTAEIDGKTIGYQADANAPDKLPELAAKVLKDFGKIDILVNNAGIMEGTGLIGEIDPAGYQKQMRVNVDAVFTLTNEVVKTMASGSRIINISSILGERAIMPGISSYNTSKFAVLGQTRSWAKDLGPKNILVNAVLPGPIDTELNPGDGPNADNMRAMIPMGRFGKPEEIASAVAFFAGPDSSFITGAELAVDGGSNA
jgi:3-oxoacyl-[acyl-carrier protein] reductase